MDQGKICPFCNVEHAPHVERCERCGRPLPARKSQFFTTERVAKSEPEVTAFLPPVEHLGDLPQDTLVLFVTGDDEPIVIENVKDVVLGRPMAEMSTVSTIDLTNHGAVMFGVSRRHAQITYTNGTFMVMDLGSTNGTALNGRSLPPARSQRLRPFDQLMLGQLRLMVYFEVELNEQGKNILLTDRQATQPLSLTPPYLASTIVPYIEALAEIQRISQGVRGQSLGNIQALHIQQGKRPAQVRLTLLMADEAIDIVRQWVGPWQHIYADTAVLTADPNDPALQPQLHDLVASIADHLIISFSEEETLLLREKLLPSVSFIATSGLELTLESLRT